MNAPSMPQYRIRRDDGSELAVPWAAALALLVRRGDIRPDTVIFDAGKGVWSKASESPVVRFIIEEIAWSGQKLPPGWTLHTDGTVAAAPPESGGSPAPSPSSGSRLVVTESRVDVPPWGDAPTIASVVPSPPPIDDASARGAESGVPDPPQRGGAPAPAAPVQSAPAWDAQEEPEVEPESAPPEPAAVPADAPSPVEPRSARAARNAARAPGPVKRIFAFSFLGTAAAVVVVGFLLRGSGGESQEVINNAEAPYTAFTPGFTTPATRDDGVSAAGFAAVGQRPGQEDSSEIQAPARPIPLPKPAVPLLTDSQIASDLTDARRSATSPVVVDLPAPPEPDRPADIPFDVAPQVRNATQVRQALEREYPIGLKETGVGGRVEMLFEVDEQGAVTRFQVKQGSGIAALDEAALRVAEAFQFTAARRRNERVPSSITLGITFDGQLNAPAASTAASGAGRSPQPGTAAAPNAAVAAASQPVATPFDVAPQVRNVSQVRQALEREYPIGLRAARIGGRVEVWFRVDEQGRVEQVQVKQSSGMPALDDAALKVARVFQFEPAQRGGERVAVWVPLGITFEAR